MNDTTDHQTHARVTQLLAAYTSHIDAQRWDAWVDLFAPDARFEVGERTITGHATLRAFAEQSTRGVHLSGLPLIEGWGADVVARSPFSFVAAGGGRLLSGLYTDDIACDGDSTLFTRRRVEIVSAAVLASAV